MTKIRSNGLAGKPSNNKGKFRPETTHLSLRIPVTLREALNSEAGKKKTTLNKLVIALLKSRVAVRAKDN